VTLLSTCVLMAGLARADELTFKALKDNTLYDNGKGPALSNGAGSRMFAGKTAADSVRRALVEFNLSQIPAGSTINSARLELSVAMSISGDVPVTVHRLLADWGEGASVAPQGQGGGASATPGDATWQHRFFPDQFWTSAGGDFVADPSATALVGIPGPYAWTDPGLVADVQAWVDSPAQHFGWIIIGDESAPSTAKALETHEATDPEARPRLIVDFTPPSVCYPDCNGDHQLNLSDFGCFQTAFALGQPYADCNGDGVRNLSDFGCFQTTFALGCP
jgi:hypothetical protein